MASREFTLNQSFDLISCMCTSSFQVLHAYTLLSSAELQISVSFIIKDKSLTKLFKSKGPWGTHNITQAKFQKGTHFDSLLRILQVTKNER